MLNDRSSPLALLSTRRSAKPREMTAPGPSQAEIERMVEIAARVPDHGKLAPWRFVVIPDAARAAFGDLLERSYAAEFGTGPEVNLAKVREFAAEGQGLVVVLSVPVREHKIPVWEQEMSAGAACLNLLHAATAMGYTGCWLTGWAAYSPGVYAGLGGEPGGRVAGFIFLGTPGRELEERPRPALGQVLRTWAA